MPSRVTCNPQNQPAADASVPSPQWGRRRPAVKGHSPSLACQGTSGHANPGALHSSILPRSAALPHANGKTGFYDVSYLQGPFSRGASARLLRSGKAGLPWVSPWLHFLFVLGDLLCECLLWSPSFPSMWVPLSFLLLSMCWSKTNTNVSINFIKACNRVFSLFFK